jgi:hypothetical protein
MNINDWVKQLLIAAAKYNLPDDEIEVKANEVTPKTQTAETIPIATQIICIEQPNQTNVNPIDKEY